MGPESPKTIPSFLAVRVGQKKKKQNKKTTHVKQNWGFGEQ